DEEGNLHVTGSSTRSPDKSYYFSSFDYATIKYNSDGKELWAARYNGPADNADRAVDLTVDTAGNVYVAGSSTGKDSGDDYATIKYNSFGAEEWVARYNGPKSHTDRVAGLVVDEFGNVYVTGLSVADSSTDYATIKYNSSGMEHWVARYNGNGQGGYTSHYPTAIGIDGEGNIYVTGESDEGLSRDFATVKYNSAGIEQWVARYDGKGTNWSWDRATSLGIDAAGNIYVTGWTDGFTKNFDYLTIKYDAGGREQWIARYEANSTRWAIAKNFVDGSGNVYVTGSPNAAETGFDYATIKYDSRGAEQWVARHNGKGSSFDEAIGLFLDDSGHVHVIGKTGRQGAGYGLVKYDSDGTLASVASFEGPGYGIDDDVNPTAVDDQGNVYVAGSCYTANTIAYFCTVKYDAFGNKLWEAHYEQFGLVTGIAVNKNGEVYITGIGRGQQTDTDIVTIKYDRNGVEQWIRHYDGYDSGIDRADALAIDRNGNVYVTGTSNRSNDINDLATNDYTTLKYDPDGVLVWVRHYDGQAGDDYDVSSIKVDEWENVCIAGVSISPNGDFDYVTIKYDKLGTALWMARYEGPEHSRDWPTDLAIDHSGNIYVTGTSATIKYNSSGEQQWVAEQGGTFITI
ncbi:MAG: SBBP repeat-containing protein, partial [Anaerolineae bacterium]|nr:SBBP repeat-containing protein [Anaerolineae bacterium]